MIRTALRNVLAHRARLLMTVLAVMLGVAFVSGTLVFTDTIGSAYKNRSANSFENISVAVQPTAPSVLPAPSVGAAHSAKKDPHLTDRLLKKLEDLPGTESATGVLSGFTALADKTGKLVGQSWGTTGTNYYPGADGEDDRYTFTKGRAPEAADEIALDSQTAERTGFKTGDTARISTGGPVMQQKIIGIFDTDDGSVAAGGTLVLFDNATAHKVLSASEYDEITIKAAPGTSEATLKRTVEKILPKKTEATTGKVLAEEQGALIAEQNKAMGDALLYFTGIALFVGTFIIANTFTMLVAQRTKELALLRAVGASRRQVTRSVLLESLIIGLVASTTGFLLGIGIAVGMRAGINALGTTVPDGPLVIAPATGLYALLVGVLVTTLAAWLPSRRAAKIPPVAAMNSVHATPTARGLVLRNSSGSATVALGVALVSYGTNLEAEHALYPLGLGGVLVMIGVFVLTPLLSRPVIAAAAPLLDRGGVAGKLARLNSVRDPRRTASTAAALMIGLTLITAMTVLATSMQGAMERAVVAPLKSDYTVSMANSTPLSPNVRKTLDRLPEVEAASPLRTAEGKVNGTFWPITGVDPKTIGELLRFDFSSGTLSSLTRGGAIIDQETADVKDLKTGDSLPYAFADGETVNLTITGVYEGNEMFKGLYVPTTVVDKHLHVVTDAQVMVKMKNGPSEIAEKIIIKALGENPAIAVQGKQAISDKYNQTINLLLNMLYGLLAMAVLIAALGVINTLTMSIFERKCEIGMLRAIGLSRAKVKQMVRLEAIVISLFGAVLGIGLGLFLAWAAGRSIVGSLPTYAMTVPYDRIAIFLALAGLVGVLAAIWPARRAARLNPLEAIKAE